MNVDHFPNFQSPLKTVHSDFRHNFNRLDGILLCHVFEGPLIIMVFLLMAPKETSCSV